MSVFKIALPGNDVKGARIGQEVLDSLYPSPKINTQATNPHVGIIRVNWASSISLSKGTVKIIYQFLHGYDYVPTCFGVYHFDNGSRKVDAILSLQLGALGIIVLNADDKYINLAYLSFDSSNTTIPPFLLDVRYYVMAERGK